MFDSRPRPAISAVAAVSLGAALAVALVIAALPRRQAPPQPLSDARPPSVQAPATPTPPPTPSARLASLHPPRPFVAEDIREETPPPPPAPARPVVLKPLAPPAVAEAKPAPAVIIKRRHDRTEADLLKEARRVPALHFDRTVARSDSAAVLAAARTARVKGRPASETTLAMLDARADLAGLPLRRGDDCKLTAPAASTLGAGSLALREMLSGSAGAALRRPGGAAASADAGSLSDLLSKDKSRYDKWTKPESVPALMQMLMGEAEGVREVLVHQVARIEGAQATEALAQLAVFDLHPRVRAAAITALATRPAGDFLPAMLRAFAHPWPPVAEHAAEALAALRVKGAVPGLLRTLDDPDPRAPYRKPGREGHFVKEMVRVNHLSNCLMCHAPSFSPEDKVRGFVPTPGEPIPQGVPYYQGQSGVFVRADITYLKQDFSASLPVENHGAWPAAQRHDFLVRERAVRPLAGPPHHAADGPTEQQKSAFFALRALIGIDPGPAVSDWKKAILGRPPEPRVAYEGFDNARALTVDAEGRAWVADADGLHRMEDGLPRRVLTGHEIVGLRFDARGRLLAARRHPSDVAVVAAEAKEVTPAAARLGDKALAAPGHLVADAWGAYFADEGGAVLYLSAFGSVSHTLAAPTKRVDGLGLSADGRTLFVASGDALHSYPVESAGNVGKGKRIATLRGASGMPGRAVGMAVDRRGRVYVANAEARTVEVFNAEGARLARLPVDAAPVAVAVGGKDEALFILTAKALHSAPLNAPGG